jgi:hypothetical protein
MDTVGGVIILLILLCVRAAPMVIAAMRNHPQIGPIIAVNILLGWTVIGWVVVLAWSFSSTKPRM